MTCKILILASGVHAIDQIRQYYVNKLVDEYPESLLYSDVEPYHLYKELGKKKTPTSVIKDFIANQLDVSISKWPSLEYIICTDPDYFKVLTGQSKPDACVGYFYNYKNIPITYIPSYKRAFYDPEKVNSKIAQGLQAIIDHASNTYTEPGESILTSVRYPQTAKEVEEALTNLRKWPVLACDIETWSLRPHEAGIASIAFSWEKGKGIAFTVDVSKDIRDTKKREYLKDFFTHYEGKLIFHNAAFDITVLIYQLFMNDITDRRGLIIGLRYFTWDFEDTKIIAYLATNSCSGNELGLKALSQEYAGNYAQEEIGNVDNIPNDQLLKYNVTDTSATLYVYEKYLPIMIKDNQEDIYRNLFKPALKDIIQMQLTGFPISLEKVKEVKNKLIDDQNKSINTLKNSIIIKDFEHKLNQDWVDRKNATLKKKKVTLEDAHEEFNPRSNLQLRELLYDTLGLPVLNKTETKQPSTDGTTLEALLNHTKSQDIKDILQALLDYSAVDKILTAFIPAFEDAVPGSDGWHYLIGNFNLGGTVSGRLSSSRPNLQQIPATGSKYAKLIKSCFVAPPGWILCGLDFNALEDHISALTTKDKNKLKVYLENFDGHCLRSYQYFKNQMPDIKQADKGERCFKAKVGNSIVYFKESDTIKYHNTLYTGLELWELLQPA